MPFFDDEKPKDECGVFGIFGHPHATELTYLGLYALQHRGQESAGIVSSNGYQFFEHRGMGLVVNVFGSGDLKQLNGHLAIGHNRYSTAGSSTLQNAQPLVRQYRMGPFAIAHNGNLVNAPVIRRELEGKGAIFACTSDTEVIAHLIARSSQIFPEDNIADALSFISGAYSLLFMGNETLIGVRDPYSGHDAVRSILDDSGPADPSHLPAPGDLHLLIEPRHIPGELTRRSLRRDEEERRYALVAVLLVFLESWLLRLNVHESLLLW